MDSTKIILDRLDRMELKLDKLSEILVQIARTEERVHNLLTKVSLQDSEINTLKERLGALETQKTELKFAMKWMRIIFYGSALTGAGSIAAYKGNLLTLLKALVGGE